MWRVLYRVRAAEKTFGAVYDVYDVRKQKINKKVFTKLGLFEKGMLQ